MSVTLEQFGIHGLDAGQRLELIELLWDSLPDEAPVTPPQWHIRELERRLANPIDPNHLETWDSVRAAAFGQVMSKRKLVIRPEATAEADDAHDHYREIDSALGSRFLNRLNEAIDRIHNSPELYGAVWQDVRAKRLKKFPYIIYYRLHESFVEITAILHGSRDSSVWQSRV